MFPLCDIISHPRTYINLNHQSTTPVVILFCTWAFRLEPYNFRQLLNVCIIVLGVMIACFGEVDFVLIGVLFQIGGIVFEAIRLVMVQRLLSSEEFKMDPLVSLYYFSPVCALMNGAVAAAVELPRFNVDDLWHVGIWMLFANAVVAFALNISVVFLVSPFFFLGGRGQLLGHSSN